MTLHAITKDAGVGIGTLYRRFPPVRRWSGPRTATSSSLCDAVPDLVRALPPDQAMRMWMGRFVDYMTTKRGMADALRAVIASGGNPYSESRDRLLAAVTALLAAG